MGLNDFFMTSPLCGYGIFLALFVGTVEFQAFISCICSYLFPYFCVLVEPVSDWAEIAGIILYSLLHFYIPVLMNVPDASCSLLISVCIVHSDLVLVAFLLSVISH